MEKEKPSTTETRLIESMAPDYSRRSVHEPKTGLLAVDAMIPIDVVNLAL
jgi:F0F1-type ATP synthase alpha subunit